MSEGVENEWHSDAGLDVVVTGWGIHVPNGNLSGLIEEGDGYQAYPADRANELLGRKGLLYKEPATLLALCAVHRALHRRAGEPRASGPADPRTAVVASSNLGNVATVQKIVDILSEAGVRGVSPFDAANASSNVLASAIAIWFRCGGPNLMVCSGATSGLDAVALGSLLLRAKRADRVLVVGAEPDDDVARRLQRESRRRLGSEVDLQAGAACVILERSTSTAHGVLSLGPSRWTMNAADIGDGHDSATIIGPRDIAPAAAGLIDLVPRVGDMSGALGVLQLAITAAMTKLRPDTPQEWTLVCGNRIEGWRSLVVRRMAIAPAEVAASQAAHDHTTGVVAATLP